MEDSTFGRLVAALLSPRRTFESIANRPTWVAALVVLVLLGATAVWSSFSRVDPQEMMRAIAEQSGRDLPPQLDPAQLHKMSMWSGVGMAVVFGPITYLLAAALFMSAARLAGSEIDFRRSFSVTLHGMLPFGLAAIVGIPIALAKETISFSDIQSGSLLASNLAAFAPEDTGGTLLALLSSFDLFSVWCIVLLTIGFSTAGRISKAAAGGSVTVVWLLGVAIKVGMAALRG